MIRSTYKRLITNTGFNGKRRNAFPLVSGVRQRYPRSPFLLSRVLVVLISIVRQEKEIKSIQIEKEEIKLTQMMWVPR